MHSSHTDQPEVAVTVIVPTLNEAGFLEPTLQSILAQDYPLSKLEVLVVDGGSTDGTVEKIIKCAAENRCIRYFDNPETTVPYALNLGISEARGDVIMRMDCHSVYPANYISTLVDCLDELDADNVGGIVRSLPPDDSCQSEAIAVVLSSPYGVGNASFRIGSATIARVDTVPFGCYPRSVFERIGHYDVSLTRNQDDEFNARLRKHGGVIYLIPDVEIQYYTRKSLTRVFRMYYQYGLFKPLANRKSGILSSYRQLAPPALVFALAGSALLSIAFAKGFILFIALLMIYATFLALAAIACRVPSARIGTRFFLLLALPTVHLAYGIGYWKGLPALINTRWIASVKGTTR
ncbi:MAG: glycosyltransferase family 2 protein [Granulosicoccus sp.]